MASYDVPCRYCEALVAPEAGFCPVCGKVNPAGPLRCPRCRNPIRKAHVKCSGCGLDLRIACTGCGQETFFGDYCDHCGEHLVVVCPHPKCGAHQPPLGGLCTKCNKPLR